YGSSRETIPQAEVAAGYCAGTIAVDAAARIAADAKLGCASSNVVASLDELLPKAKTSLAITNLDRVTARWRALRVDGISFFEDPAHYPLIVGASPDFAPSLTHFIMT